jgi:hypothetical protein
MLRIRRIRGAYRRAGLTVALALAALAVVPAIASAAAVSTSGTVITYQAATGSDGENNDLTVTHPGTNTYFFNDTVSITETSPNCTASSGNVTCSGVSWTSVVVNLENKDDIFNATGVNDDPFTINAGDGLDTITGSDADDTINGEKGNDPGLSGGLGNDTIDGGDNDDTINGGDGNDRLIGEGGNDVFNGNAGIDRVRYDIGCSEGTPTITITIDGTANDAGCNSDSADNVGTTVESVTGSTGIDTITGSCFANTIVGDPGTANGNPGAADTINGDPNTCSGGNGNDFMGGGEGSDIFDGDGTTGAAGFDTVTYGAPYTGAVAGTCSGQAVTTGFAVNLDTDNTADDCDGFGNTLENVHSDIERIIGSGADDRINATAAAQGVSLYGRDGADTLTDSPFGDFLAGQGGADTINCPNGGTDSYNVDPADTVTGSCEIGT